MAKDIYIVSDVHGDAKALREALYGAGIYDNHGQKDPNAFVVQLGDLANCVQDSRENDLEVLGYVGREIDLMLVGNHEMPYFDRGNRFGGFFWDAEISYVLGEMKEAGVIVPCFVHKDTLITHAGFTQSQMSPVSGFGTNAFDISLDIQDAWETNLGHRYFSDIGKARYGRDKVGGILWCDFDKEFEPTEFPQIVGHTPGVLRKKGNALCIDTQITTGKPTVINMVN